MSAWCHEGQFEFRVSKNQLPETLPPATTYWVRGFLTGNVPHQPLWDHDDDPALVEWNQRSREFLATGTWPPEPIDDSSEITLTSDEVLILFDLLHRWEDEGQVTAPRHKAEQIALWNLSSSLEREVFDPFNSVYDDLVADARERLSPEEE